MALSMSVPIITVAREYVIDCDDIDYFSRAVLNIMVWNMYGVSFVVYVWVYATKIRHHLVMRNIGRQRCRIFFNGFGNHNYHKNTSIAAPSGIRVVLPCLLENL